MTEGGCEKEREGRKKEKKCQEEKEVKRQDCIPALHFPTSCPASSPLPSSRNYVYHANNSLILTGRCARFGLLASLDFLLEDFHQILGKLIVVANCGHYGRLKRLVQLLFSGDLSVTGVQTLRPDQQLQQPQSASHHMPVLPQICIKYQMPYLLFTPNHIM